MAACLRLTELTLIYPRGFDARVTEPGVTLDRVGITRSTTIELVSACKALLNFNTLQIVHFFGPKVLVEGVKDLTVHCLKTPEMGCQEGEGRKKTTLRVIGLCRYRIPGKIQPGAVVVGNVEVYEV